jgi:hypothetical protein
MGMVRDGLGGVRKRSATGCFSANGWPGRATSGSAGATSATGATYAPT